MTDLRADMARLVQILDSVPAAEMIDATHELLSVHLPLECLWLYVGDYGDDVLRPVPNRRLASPPAQELGISGTLAGRSFLTRQAHSSSGDGPVDLWLPVYSRSESLGVLGLGFHGDGSIASSIPPELGPILGSAILTARRYSDVFEVPRGARHLRLAAAIHWELLPLPSYADPSVEIAGRLEPAYDIAGDAFDFAANGDILDLAIFDPVGHGLQATLLTTLAVGGYRYSRRREETLGEIAAQIDEAISRMGSDEVFATGQICRLDVTTGHLGILNAGHLIPILVRNGKAASIGAIDPTVPFGVGIEPGRPMAEFALEPDDVVLFYSDGLVEARNADGEPYGIARVTDGATRHIAAGQSLAKAVRTVVDSVLAHVPDRLGDDATLLAVRWKGRAR